MKFFHLCNISIDHANDSACYNNVIIIGLTPSVEVTRICVRKSKIFHGCLQ